MKPVVAGVAGLLAIASLALVTPPASAGDDGRPTTTIVMNVTGCEGCSITPTQGLKASPDDILTWAGKPRTVSGGRVIIIVPTFRTQGMSFTIQTPVPVEIDAMPVITIQYEGARPGSVVTKAQAKASASASACWPGTLSPSVTLSVRVARVVLPSTPSPGNASVPLAWVVPTIEAGGGFQPTAKGVLGTQEDVGAFCPAF